MARAAAKRRPPVRHHDDRRRHKDSGGQRFEDTLFFNRLRKQAKWVFILLVVAFGLGFVLFGVGSSNVSGLGDIFNGVGGGGGGPSVSKPLKATQRNPKDAGAWKDLATAYELKQDYAAAIPAWETYTRLRPKDADALQHLAGDYQQQLDTRAAEAQAAQLDVQIAQPTAFGPPADSPLGRALGATPDPLLQAATAVAADRANTAYSAYQDTALNVERVYQRLAALQPTDPGSQLQVAQAAEIASDFATAIAAYKRFVTLAPDDASAPQAKARIKTLQAQLAGSSTP